MHAKWFLSIFVTFCCTLLCGFLPGARDWWRSVGKRPFVACVLFISVISVFLGNPRGVTAIAENPVDTIRVFRILVLSILTVTAVIVIVFSKSRVFAGWGARWMALYAGIAMISSFYSPFPLLSLWKGFEVLSHVAVGIMVGGSLHQREDIEHVINIILLAMLFLVISALASSIISPSLAFAKMEHTGQMAFMLRGVYPRINANTLSQISAIVAACSLCCFFSVEKTTSRFGALLVFVMALACLLLSHSRTSLLIFFPAVCFIVMFFRAKIIAFTTLWIGIILVLSGFVIDNVIAYILRGQSKELFLCLSGRTDFWDLVLEKIYESPIIGHGFYASQRMSWGTSTVDNTYLEVLLGVGIVGLTFFCMAVISVFLNLWKANQWNSQKNIDPNWRLVWIQQTVIFLFLFFRSLTGPSFQILHPSLTIFIIVAVCSSATVRIQNAEYFLLKRRQEEK